LRGEVAPKERVRGTRRALTVTVLVEAPPRPNPLPAGGERE
jgi:hypothetical protein